MNEIVDTYVKAEKLQKCWEHPIAEVVKMALCMMPYTATLFSGTSGQIDKLIEKRRKKKLEMVLREVIALDSLIDIQIFQTIEVLEEFKLMFLAVEKTNTDEKIRMLAKLFVNSQFVNPISNDKYEEYIEIVGRVSCEQFNFMVRLRTLLHENEYNSSDKFVIISKKLCEEFNVYTTYAYFNILESFGFLKLRKGYDNSVTAVTVTEYYIEFADMISALYAS